MSFTPTNRQKYMSDLLIKFREDYSGDRESAQFMDDTRAEVNRILQLTDLALIQEWHRAFRVSSLT